MNADILKQGSVVKAHIKIAGILQLHTFVLGSKKTAFGEIPVLSPEKKITLPITEALKVANQLGIPVHSSSGLVFPTGKSVKDFIKG